LLDFFVSFASTATSLIINDDEEDGFEYLPVDDDMIFVDKALLRIDNRCECNGTYA